MQLEGQNSPQNMEQESMSAIIAISTPIAPRYYRCIPRLRGNCCGVPSGRSTDPVTQPIQMVMRAELTDIRVGSTCLLRLYFGMDSTYLKSIEPLTCYLSFL